MFSSVRQDAEIGVTLIKYPDARRVRRAELVDEPVNDLRLRLPLGVREVDHVQQHVGIRQLLERGLERLDEVRGQLADEADGVLERPDLRRREVVVEHDQIRAGVLQQLAHLLRLALADEAVRIGRFAVLQHLGCAFAARRLQQRLQLVEGFLGSGLLRAEAIRIQPDQNRLFYRHSFVQIHKYLQSCVDENRQIMKKVRTDAVRTLLITSDRTSC